MDRQRKMSFVDEVFDQFLVCRMCSKPYKNPKVLTCLHSFCCKCLEDYYDMEEQDRSYKFLLYNRALGCPLCRQKTELPVGGIPRLPENTLLENLGNVVKKNMPPAEGAVKWCDICRINSENSIKAVSKCLDCLKHLCTSCSELHLNTKVTKFHAIIDLQIEKTVQCKIHEGELIKYFCESCDECICTLCAFHQHKNHEVSLLADVLVKNKESFTTMLGECKHKVEDLKNQIDFIDWCDASIKCTENKIRESVTETIVLMRQKEREMISSIRDIVGQEIFEFLNQKEILEDNLNKLENTYKNTSCTADNIELLLAKKNLQMHLSEISKEQMIHFDRNLSRDYSIFKNKDHFETIRSYISMLSLQQDCLKVKCLVLTENRDTQTEKVELIDEKQQKSLAIVKPIVKTEEKSTEIDLDCKTLKTGLTWQKSFIRLEVENNIIPINHIYLKPAKPRHVATRDNFTSMERITRSDNFTQTNQVTKMERSTATMQVMVMHKNVETVSQKTTDKSTCTSADVSIVARAIPALQKKITVSRGTNTNNAAFVDKASSPDLLNEFVPTIDDKANENSSQADETINFEDEKYEPLKGENLNVKVNNMLVKSSKQIRSTPNQPLSLCVSSSANNNISRKQKFSNNFNNNLVNNTKSTNNDVKLINPTTNINTNINNISQYKNQILKIPGAILLPNAKVAFLSGKLQNQLSPTSTSPRPFKSSTIHPVIAPDNKHNAC